MKILALDAAFDAVSVAVLADGAVLSQAQAAGGRGQGEILMPMIKRVMAEAGVAFAGLDRIAVTIGPGHFTGLRLGLAAARGLGLAAGKPLDGITTFDAVLGAVPDDERGPGMAVVAFETKRADLYGQVFAIGLGGFAPAGAPGALAPADLAARIPPGPRLLLVGDGAPRLAAALAGRDFRISRAPALPHAVWVARIAASRVPSVRPGLTPSPEPLYLRPPDVTTPRNRTPEWNTPPPDPCLPST